MPATIVETIFACPTQKWENIEKEKYLTTNDNE